MRWPRSGAYTGIDLNIHEKLHCRTSTLSVDSEYEGTPYGKPPSRVDVSNTKDAILSPAPRAAKRRVEISAFQDVQIVDGQRCSARSLQNIMTFDSGENSRC
ncbi:hypothetical protein PsYK624_166010 [Phanerochaete sordida]|uniref:Uncharacterized protein n=1 Tax=Phanerochaete sordida TaxID=48140 RepID=A0A9P3LMD6_9APHY|nr:hypothetical protein PsYK624_166010 [Phanerochaete sordida]